VVGADDLVVIANTGDDVEIWGAYVSPDPDLITFWLADLINSQGWGLEGDTSGVADGLRDLGHEIWFNLGDRDLAIAIDRAQALNNGTRYTEAQARITTALGVHARVLPMSDRPVRTRVMADDTWWPIQEFLIQRRGKSGPVQDVIFRHAGAAEPTPEVLDAIKTARAIVIGPSNPVISIGPMLAVAGLKDAIQTSSAPKVAVSPVVRGQVLKGPTEAFLKWAGQPISSAGIAAIYDGLIDGLIADERTEAVPVLETDLLMSDAAGRRRLAGETLHFALAFA
jgi:LPPG:FO 2-phospho-L-lactate transferase